jgi:restriction system protein
VKTEKSIAAPQPHVPQRTHLDTQLLDELDWLLFEELTAEYFRLDGFRADLSRMGSDGGVDIYLHRMGEPRPFAYVQCKAWGSRQIGVEPMRALYGVMAAAGIKEGYFVCIGEFSTDARAFAEANKIQMITGDLFISRFNRFPETDRVRVLTRITQGDYTTPSCAKCGTKMKTKDFSGRGHWCCPRYPKCRSKPIAVRQRS